MDDIVGVKHHVLAGEFRELTASYEGNRDLVLMGAYRLGADAQLDRAILMHDLLTAFLCQAGGEIIDIDTSAAQLGALLGA